MTSPIRIRILTHNGVPYHDYMGHYRNAQPDDVSCKVYTVTEMVEAAPIDTELATFRDQAASREEDVRSLNEIVSRLDTENAALRKALDDRGTVEGWALTTPRRSVSIVAISEYTEDPPVHKPSVQFYEEDEAGECTVNEMELADTFDEAFSAAAEWVRTRQ